jgi:hypothetical protein
MSGFRNAPGQLYVFIQGNSAGNPKSYTPYRYRPRHTVCSTRSIIAQKYSFRHRRLITLQFQQEIFRHAFQTTLLVRFIFNFVKNCVSLEMGNLKSLTLGIVCIGYGTGRSWFFPYEQQWFFRRHHYQNSILLNGDRDEAAGVWITRTASYWMETGMKQLECELSEQHPIEWRQGWSSWNVNYQNSILLNGDRNEAAGMWITRTASYWMETGMKQLECEACLFFFFDFFCFYHRTTIQLGFWPFKSSASRHVYRLTFSVSCNSTTS